MKGIIHLVSHRRRLCLAAVALTAAATACSPRVDTRGNVPDAEMVAQIKPGLHTRNEVAGMLGTPSSLATFDQKTWYYISKKTETTAFFDPKVVEQQVVAVKFDDTGTVAQVDRLGLEDARDVQISDRESPTRGKELGLFEQLYKTLLRGRGDTGANEGFVK